jgi:transposase InsO family protein
MPLLRARSTSPVQRRVMSTDRRVLDYIQPGKPDQDAYIERFNRSYRTEVLNAHLFESIAELRALTNAWLRIYNSARPHDSLGRVPPLTFCRGHHPKLPAWRRFERRCRPSARSRRRDGSVEIP